MDKKVLRKELIVRRSMIPDKLDKSRIIMEKIMDLELFKKARVVALYKSLLHEVNTDFLINYSQECGKIVLLPRVINQDLVFLTFKKDDLLEESFFHVLEPIYNENNIYNGNIDLMIVPGVGFDKNNNRIGYGRGYYDRFLVNKNIYKIGVCFYEQLLDSIPIDEHDVKMDLVIHEK